MAKKILKVAGMLVGIILILVIGLLTFLTVTDYKPDAVQPAEFTINGGESASAEQSLTVYSWNIGYGGLGKDSDFFMDGGEMVNPPSQEIVETNIAAIKDFIETADADMWLLQEVDKNSAHTNGIDEFSMLSESFEGGAFTYNYKCKFVPFPWPTIGRVESGLTSLSDFSIADRAERIALPSPFSWPVSTANLKRCLLITRTPIEGSDKEIVFVNLHLEAYESGEGRIAQTKMLMELMQEEYAKGNYVIAGGDFNQSFPGSLDAYPIMDTEKWTPGIIDKDVIPEGWNVLYDNASPSCRLLDQPYNENCQLYVIDGFITSPNVIVESVETVNLDFQHSDHNPVKLKVQLAA
ncbi:MAG: endonuclease [Firmicutes bacterium]|nr:endonuclease [Bacillota bacterium]